MDDDRQLMATCCLTLILLVALVVAGVLTIAGQETPIVLTLTAAAAFGFLASAACGD